MTRKESRTPLGTRIHTSLSYPEDDGYITVCDHEHDAKCDRCELLPTVFSEIKTAVGNVDCSAEERDEM